MVEFLVAMIATVMQALLALILGVFGFAWDAPEDENKEAAVITSISRMHQQILPIATMQFIPAQPNTTLSGCNSQPMQMYLIDTPLLLDTKSQPQTT